MKRTHTATVLYALTGGVLLALGAANLWRGFPLYGAVTLLAGLWFGLVAAAALRFTRRPESIGKQTRQLLGDITIVVTAVVALGLVGFDAQFRSPFLPLYVVLVAVYLYRRRRPGYDGWQVF